MCPPASIPAPLDFSISSTDEEVLLFLGGRKAGDPVPSNIITEVNPFTVEPRHSPEGMWYLYYFEDGCSSNQRSIFKVVQVGYWRFLDRLTINRGNVPSGRKTIWEFCIGQEPLGMRTCWLMYDYQRVQNTCQGIGQDCNSMYRVFLQEDERKIIGDQMSPDTEHGISVNLDNVDGEDVESMLLHFLETEESSSTINAASQFELGEPEQRHDRSIQDLVTSDSPADLNAFVEQSKGDYLELNDLFDLESTSSSSDDSSLISRSSDDCFDAEALLKDLEDDGCNNSKAEGLNPRFNDASSAKPSPEAIRLSQSAGSNKINNELVLANSSSSDGCSSKTSSPLCKFEHRFNACTSASGSVPRDHPKRTHSGRSEGSSSSNGSGSKSVTRFAKLRKKYCCFAPF